MQPGHWDAQKSGPGVHPSAVSPAAVLRQDSPLLSFPLKAVALSRASGRTYCVHPVGTGPRLLQIMPRSLSSHHSRNIEYKECPDDYTDKELQHLVFLDSFADGPFIISHLLQVGCELDLKRSTAFPCFIIIRLSCWVVLNCRHIFTRRIPHICLKRPA